MPGLNDNWHPFDADLKGARQRFAHPQGRRCPSEVEAFFQARRRHVPPIPGDCPDESVVDQEVRPNAATESDPAKCLAARKQAFRDAYLRDKVEALLQAGASRAQLLDLRSDEDMARKGALFDKASSTTGNPLTGGGGEEAKQKERMGVEEDGHTMRPVRPVPLATTGSLTLAEASAAAASIDAAAASFPVPECTCDLFVPFQKEELVRRLIERALDNVLGDLDGEKPTAGNGLRELKRRKVIKDIFPLHYEVDPKFYRLNRAQVVQTYCSYKRLTSWAAALSFSEHSPQFIGWMRGE